MDHLDIPTVEDEYLDALEASRYEKTRNIRACLCCWFVLCLFSTVVTASLYFGWKDIAPDILLPIMCASIGLGFLLFFVYWYYNNK